jgi:hypothetical protein
MRDQHREAVLLGALRCGTHGLAWPGRVGQGLAWGIGTARLGRACHWVGGTAGQVRAAIRGAVAIKPSPFFYRRQPTYQRQASCAFFSARTAARSRPKRPNGLLELAVGARTGRRKRPAVALESLSLGDGGVRPATHCHHGLVHSPPGSSPIRGERLDDRRVELRKLLARPVGIRFSGHLAGDGEKVTHRAFALGLCISRLSVSLEAAISFVQCLHDLHFRKNRRSSFKREQGSIV